MPREVQIMLELPSLLVVQRSALRPFTPCSNHVEDFCMSIQPRLQNLRCLTLFYRDWACRNGPRLWRRWPLYTVTACAWPRRQRHPTFGNRDRGLARRLWRSANSWLGFSSIWKSDPAGDVLSAGTAGMALSVDAADESSEPFVANDMSRSVSLIISYQPDNRYG